jgi:hypothetical protein
MLMPLTLFFRSKYLALGAVAFVFATLVSWALAVSSGSGNFLGVCLVGVGILYIAMYRKSGERAFRQGKELPLVSGLWGRLGKEGAQTLYLGIGVALARSDLACLQRTLLSK